MNRKYAVALIAVLLGVAAIAVLWFLREDPVATGPALPSFDYAADDSWAVKPDLPPPAVWETGWEIDVVLLSGAAALETSDQVALERRQDDADEELQDLATAFEKAGAVYTPYLRAANLEADMASALTQYLSTDNRGRAFLIAADVPLPASVVPVFEADSLLRDRFGGVLLYGDASSASGFADGVSSSAICSRRNGPDEGCAVPVEVRRAGRGYEMTGSDMLTDGLIAWLNDNVPKLAEPLGELEEIEVIEIQRPNEGE